MKLNEKIENPVFNAGITYVVEGNVTFSQSVVIPEDVTLIFQGGRFVVADDCTGEITITGTGTRLIAPICTVFGKGINVVGSWNIDRAYPQWFELKDDNDWSYPINKAIDMKGIGEVFLKSGIYEVYNSIKMPKWIQLIGESSQMKAANDTEHSTIISPKTNGNGTFTDGYVIHVNTPYVYDYVETKYKNYQFIDQSTLIKNICFTNWGDNEPSQKCILAGGGVQLDKIVWYNFLQAVKYTDTYNDTRSITNCSFKTDRNEDNTSDVYAFDTGWLGDALRFEHNAIHNTCNSKALKLYNCGGASIQGNIINSDVFIKDCKAILFNANHCEDGVQIEILNSGVTTNNNYLHIGKRPNYYIHNSEYGDESVVSLQNDMLIKLDPSKDTTDGTDLYNIVIDKRTILKISNVYRYDATTKGFGKMFSFGINIQKADKTPLEEFNDYSYIASRNSEICPNYSVYLSSTVKNVNAPHIFAAMLTGIGWNLPEGTYRYYYQITWDKKRNIKKTETNESQSIFPILWYNFDGSMTESNTVKADSNGVLLQMTEDINGNYTMVRFIREDTVNATFKEVYVPVCGSLFVYDYGTSVCGYEWKDISKNDIISSDFCDKNMEMFKISNGNVECFTKREGGITPTSGWKRGDVIYNIGSNSSTYIIPDDIA